MKKLDIIYEDKEFLVVNKPPKMLTIATDKDKEHNLYREVREYIKKKNQKVFIVHRLDKDTSGLVLFAKNEKLKKALQNNWNNYDRDYIAIVEGHLPKNKDTITCYLNNTKTLDVYVSNSREGKKAITSYEVLSKNKSVSLVKVNIKTGRKNQIRATFNYLGHNIVGDKKYKSTNNYLGRLALHHYHLSIIHPFKNKKIELFADIPKIFNMGFNDVNLSDYIKKYRIRDNLTKFIVTIYSLLD